MLTTKLSFFGVLWGWEDFLPPTGGRFLPRFLFSFTQRNRAWNDINNAILHMKCKLFPINHVSRSTQPSLFAFCVCIYFDFDKNGVILPKIHCLWKFFTPINIDVIPLVQKRREPTYNCETNGAHVCHLLSRYNLDFNVVMFHRWDNFMQTPTPLA